MTGYVTLAELARREGVTRQAVSLWLKRSRVTPIRIGGMALLSPADCRRLVAGRRPNGRPRKTPAKVA